ncbi:hypothetical protein OIU77_028419 [Salix suchowensis]|uniref:Uncharacterized protein n=1 Tax=Salix suchowensis TaxID=1278906 RepID=A0ABQ9BL76_9ROSI|nr:hypothetical protein OIU77_028419 [Salix suchowensis]
MMTVKATDDFSSDDEMLSFITPIGQAIRKKEFCSQNHGTEMLICKMNSMIRTNFGIASYIWHQSFKIAPLVSY